MATVHHPNASRGRARFYVGRPEFTALHAHLELTELRGDYVARAVRARFPGIHLEAPDSERMRAYLEATHAARTRSDEDAARDREWWLSTPYAEHKPPHDDEISDLVAPVLQEHGARRTSRYCWRFPCPFHSSGAWELRYACILPTADFVGGWWDCNGPGCGTFPHDHRPAMEYLDAFGIDHTVGLDDGEQYTILRALQHFHERGEHVVAGLTSKNNIVARMAAAGLTDGFTRAELTLGLARLIAAGRVGETVVGRYANRTPKRGLGKIRGQWATPPRPDVEDVCTN